MYNIIRWKVSNLQNRGNLPRDMQQICDRFGMWPSWVPWNSGTSGLNQGFYNFSFSDNFHPGNFIKKNPTYMQVYKIGAQIND